MTGAGGGGRSQMFSTGTIPAVPGVFDSNASPSHHQRTSAVTAVGVPRGTIQCGARRRTCRSGARASPSPLCTPQLLPPVSPVQGGGGGAQCADTRRASDIRQVTCDQKEQGSTEPHTGRRRVLLSSWGWQGGMGGVNGAPQNWGWVGLGKGLN